MQPVRDFPAIDTSYRGFIIIEDLCGFFVAYPDEPIPRDEGIPIRDPVSRVEPSNLRQVGQQEAGILQGLFGAEKADASPLVAV